MDGLETMSSAASATSVEGMMAAEQPGAHVAVQQHQQQARQHPVSACALQTLWLFTWPHSGFRGRCSFAIIKRGRTAGTLQMQNVSRHAHVCCGRRWQPGKRGRCAAAAHQRWPWGAAPRWAL